MPATINSPKIGLNDYLFAVYKWIENSGEKNVLRNINIAKRSYQLIKQHIYRFLIENFESNLSVKLGGQNKTVQIDETAICHCSLVDCPSRLDDDTPGLTWLVGIIESDSRRIKFEIVDNRSLPVMMSLLERHVLPFTTVISDVHRSYPRAVANINGAHIIVNHSVGFKNAEGFHTNNIENLWSLLKYKIKKRRGVLKSNLVFS